MRPVGAIQRTDAWHRYRCRIATYWLRCRSRGTGCRGSPSLSMAIRPGVMPLLATSIRLPTPVGVQGLTASLVQHHQRHLEVDVPAQLRPGHAGVRRLSADEPADGREGEVAIAAHGDPQPPARVAAVDLDVNGLREAV